MRAIWMLHTLIAAIIYAISMWYRYTDEIVGWFNSQSQQIIWAEKVFGLSLFVSLFINVSFGLVMRLSIGRRQKMADWK